ncbi:pentatricopeptide repeat-containing protein, partial [Acrasis kona]
MYGCTERSNLAVQAYQKMLQDGSTPNEITYSIVIISCANGALMEIGDKLIKTIENKVQQMGPILINSIMLFYGKTGNLERAVEVFESLGDKKNIITWNVILQCCAVSGSSEEASRFFGLMIENGIEPNLKSIGSLLNAHSHSLNVEGAKDVFDQMLNKYNLIPDVHTQISMVDVLGRSGAIEQAEDLLNSVCFDLVSDEAFGLSTLLGACRIHGNLDVAERTFTKLDSMGLADSASYVSMMNIYAKYELWDKRANVHAEMQRKGVKRTPGISQVEVNGMPHKFVVSDRSFSSHEQVHDFLSEIRSKVMDLGYNPDLKCVTRQMSTREEKIQHLWEHSEKIAVAFALLNTGTDVVVTKNLRMCEDCHKASAYISMLYPDRKIKIRDASRFHTFKNGKCSCNNK